MVNYTLWDTEVDLDLDKENFPSPEQLKSIDAICGNPEHFFFQTKRGDKLHCCKHLPSTTPRGVIIWQHGIQAWTGNTFEFPNGEKVNKSLLADMFVKAGFAMYSMDLLGHGYSEGLRFYIPNGDWTIHLEELREFTELVNSEMSASTPFFLMGESYGACLAIHLARQLQNQAPNSPRNFKGVAVLCPAIIGDLPPAPVVFILRNIIAPLFPESSPFFMPHPISPHRIWKNELVRAHNSSEEELAMGLHGGGKTFRLGTAAGLLAALEEVRTEAIPGLTVPFCVVHGTEDYGVPIAGTEYLLEHSSTPKDLRGVRLVDGAYHDLLSEDSREETVQFIIDWINQIM